jgi:hypothetical protein
VNRPYKDFRYGFVAEILELKRALENAKVLGNLIRTYGLPDRLDFKKLNSLLTEVNNRLALINQREALESDEDNSNIINMALEEIVFSFRKVSERELPLGLVARSRKGGCKVGGGSYIYTAGWERG